LAPAANATLATSGSLRKFVFIITVKTVTVTPSPWARAIAATTGFQFPPPRKASCSASVGKSIETST